MKLKRRNAEAVLDQLYEDKSKQVIAKSRMTLQIPVRFKEIGLAQIGATTFIYGLFSIVLDNGDYAICNVNALIELGKCSIELETIDGAEYYNFIFEPGSVLFKTTELVARAALVFKAIEEFIFKGKIPYYVAYDDIGKLFDTAKKHAQTRADLQPAVTEFMAAYIARDSQNRIKFLRETAKTYEDFDKKLEWVPMQSVYWSSPGTVNKIAGAYFQEGVVSALVNPSERVEKIESILRA